MADVTSAIKVIRIFDQLLADKLVVEADCIVYSGYRSRDGYGKLNRKGRVQFVHRYVYGGFFGEVPDGMKVLHRCDNPPCCNPQHLFIGTQRDNIVDMLKKGRGRWPGKRGRIGCVGERNPKSKLTIQDVAWIRRYYSPKYHSPYGSARLAERFGVNRGTILMVAQGKTWRGI